MNRKEIILRGSLLCWRCVRASVASPEWRKKTHIDKFGIGCSETPIYEQMQRDHNGREGREALLRSGYRENAGKIVKTNESVEEKY